MRIKEALKSASQEIATKEAKILLAHHLGKDRLYLIINEDEEVDGIDLYFDMVDRFKSGEPIEYITNRVSFYSKEFYIDKRALIPRPETEILVDMVLDRAKELDSPKIAEIGVGSGVISIILAVMIEDIKIVATDLSNDAILVSKINAKKFKVEGKINFKKSNLLDKIDQNFDIIVSNPPYIKRDFKIDKNLTYEPKLALFGGDKGDEILKEIIDLAIKKEPKYLCCEIGYDQKDSLDRYMRERGVVAKFYKDLAGFDRGFIARIKDE